MVDKSLVSAWLEALPGEASGPDLEYDPAFMELAQAAAGKPETQFGPAEPPNWPATRELAETLFAQTRDLRVAMLWGRAAINLAGVEGLSAALFLLHGLLENLWDDLHPRPDPDDGDVFARVSVLGSLDSLEGLLGDVRQSQLLMERRLGGLRMRDVEIALDRLAPRADEQTYTVNQVAGMLADQPDLSARLKVAVEDSLASLKALQSLMNSRFDIGAVDVKALREMLTGLQSQLPEADAQAAAPASEDEPGDDASDAPAARPRGGGGGGVMNIESRKDAVKAINLVCAYLERSEPTNPAQLLLRRAERLIDKNFLQLIQDMAPDAVNEVARIMGVDPDSLRDSGSY